MDSGDRAGVSACVAEEVSAPLPSLSEATGEPQAAVAGTESSAQSGSFHSGACSYSINENRATTSRG